MHIYLIRDNFIKTLAILEVPDDDCINLITLLSENDSVSICKGQINTISINDIIEQS